MYFDPRAAKLLQPGNHIVIGGCSGLRLIASTEGKSWVYRYKSPVNGNMRQIKLGSWPSVSASMAATKWQELKDLRDAGKDPAQEKQDKRKAEKLVVYTVGDAVHDYINRHLNVNRKPAGAKAVAARLLSATQGIAKLSASGVTRGVAFDLISGLSAKPELAKSVRNELGGAWELALDAGRLSADSPNWWRQILSGRLRSKGALRDGVHKGTEKRVLSDIEVSTLLTVDFHLFSQQVRDFLTIQLWTCTRGSEIVQMHKTHITQEKTGWWWTVPKELTKNKGRANASDLRVPLVGRSLEIVQRILLNDGSWLFPSVSRTGVIGHQEQPYMQSKVHYYQPYSKSRPDHIRARLTVTHWSPHDLRRTGRTGLAALGCPMEIAESILGHVQPGIQGVYNLFKYDTERLYWLTKWSDKLAGISSAVSNREI